jgi:membrane fusion protein (multidrug efflux system)
MKQILYSRISQIFGVLMLITLFVIQACGEKPKETDAKDKTIYTDTISVEAQIVELKELALSKSFSGSLEGEEQANIIAKIPETITKIRVKVGDFVKVGSILFELNKGGASSQFYQAQAAYLNAQKDFERMQNLLKEGAVSQQAFDGTQTLYEVAKANFDAARSTVEITSPLSGIVTSINVNLGDFANPQFPMATVANIGRIKAKFNVGESDVPGLFVGQQVSVYSEMNPDLIQPGKINQLSKSADIQSRTFEMQAIFSNTQDRWFKPGMFCRVDVKMKSKKNVHTIPLSAIVKSSSSDGVYIINDGKSYLKTITTGLSDGKNVEVISGLKSGDQIVTLGMNNLKDGTVVVVTNK